MVGFSSHFGGGLPIFLQLEEAEEEAGAVSCSVVWYGIEWYGVELYGMIWLLVGSPHWRMVPES